MPAMDERTIRAWHYTRLTDDEVTSLTAGGIYLSDLPAIRRWLDMLVRANLLSEQAAEALYAASPFHKQTTRVGKFWMTSHCLHPSDSGVELLLGHWGGEGVYFWLNDEVLTGPVKQIGLPRAVEIAVPLHATKHAYAAANAVTAAFVMSNGCKADWPAFDLYTQAPLGSETILNIMTEGDPEFSALSHGYPVGYVDREL